MLSDIARHSTAHQILLANGEIDVVPTSYIAELTANLPSHRVWLEDEIVELIKANYDDNVLAAFTSIKPLAYKADLARYCIIHTLGGWYFDLTVTIDNFNVLDSFSEDISTILFRDIPIANRMATVANTLFWFKDSGSEILKLAIEKSVSNILSSDYTWHPHGITGPLMLGDIVADYQSTRLESNILFGDTLMVADRPTHTFSTVHSPNTMTFSHRRAMSDDVTEIMPTGYESKSDYWRLWHEKKVY